MYSAGGINWTPRIGRIRGLDIRLHLTMLFLVGFWLLSGLADGGPRGLVQAAVLTAALFGLILWHELGHAWAARRCGLPVSGIVLWPLGGECQISGAMPSPRAELFIALAGPAAHALLVLAAFLPVVLLLPTTRWFNPMGAASALAGAWSLAVYILLFNLVPMFPLDGGRAFRALLTYRMGDVGATLVAVRVGQVLAGLLALVGLVFGALMLVALGIFIIFSAENELRMVRYAGYVYDPSARGPLAASLGIKDDWSREALEAYGRPDRPGFFARMRTRWRLRRLARATRRRQALEAEVDRILEKVSREGMTALTGRERRVLKEASGEYRRRSR